MTTGTGATGWARSITEQRKEATALPKPTEQALAFFVREAWPSRTTGTTLSQGLVDGRHPLELISEMNEDGVLFGDGIENDHLDFAWGMRATLTTAPDCLKLVR